MSESLVWDSGMVVLDSTGGSGGGGGGGERGGGGSGGGGGGGIDGSNNDETNEERLSVLEFEEAEVDVSDAIKGGGGGGGAGSVESFEKSVSAKPGKFGIVRSCFVLESFSSIVDVGVGRSSRTVGVVTAEEGAIGLWELKSKTNFSSSTIPGRSGSISGTFICGTCMIEYFMWQYVLYPSLHFISNIL